jgi:hypothetical protein
MRTVLLVLVIFWLAVLYIVASAYACDATCKSPGIEALAPVDQRACLDRSNVVRNAYREQVLADCVRTFKHRYELSQ